MAKDKVTGKIVQERLRDKIQYQTSFTDLPIFVAYCQYLVNKEKIAVKEFSSELAQIRKQFNSWKGDKDTHAALTLLQFGLIFLEKDNYFISELGKNFLSLFNDKFELIKSREEFLKIVFTMINTWHFNINDYDIHPGRIILKLMTEEDLHFNVTSQDIAHIFIYEKNKIDSQYQTIKQQIIEFRNKGKKYNQDELKKTYTLLTGFVNWGIFVLDKNSNSNIKIVRLKDDFAEVVRKEYSCVEIADITEEKIIELIEKTDEFDAKVDKWASQYGDDGYQVGEHRIRVGQIQDAFKTRLVSKNSRKCMLCDVTHPEMLIASHIKSYKNCASILEKIDESNGLLLCANHDKLFDKFLISFEAFTGKILISKNITKNELKIFCINENTCLDETLLTEKRQEYLIWHNSEFYKKNRG